MTDDIDKSVMTSRGSARDLSPYTVNVSYAGSGANWFGPLQPMQPVAPPEVAGRAFDYPTGYNLNTTPRPYEPVTFEMLRSLADNCDLLRVVTERKKDQLTRLPWTIRARHDGPAHRRPKASQLPVAQRERIRALEAFFREPDYLCPFSSWLRSLLEDLLVIDAPSLYCQRDSLGRLVRLQVSDGATIKRIIDPRGRTPEPFLWDGGPFEWNGQLITAADAASQRFVIQGSVAFPPAYQQLLHGLPAANLTVRDLVYRPMNLRPGHVFGYSPTEQVLRTVNIAIRRAQYQAEYYESGNQPESLFSLPASWTPDQVQRFQDYWDNLYSGNLATRRRMKFLAADNGKNSYIPIKEPALTNEMDHWLARVICLAFSYPVSGLVPQVNRATAEQAERSAEEEGVEPIKQWFADLANDVIRSETGFDDVEFAWIEENEVDQKRQAEILTSYVDSGVLTIDEARERIGEEPSANPMARVLAVKTATGRVPIDTKGDAA
ncbi:phage portal protein [Bradyrhizobium japonicum]|uniref:phage portal protein n=1 Tax=Bradyrhizobium japonicum TaxID=375 RepID=UPI000689381C|nr:phage portal protein [Bradyrhizobium japonicum]MCD9110273.1 phage portal protein [Bradyrhizobium japonicum]MCD9257452.1 phage portal protein [Bradyrhizobium japonicum SEMIA 5079]MCD9823513.1 phage portal protein [Bradyrhizobium japonicum]MCD9895116.1 phage portal protein [Bradyrhizobium japonicum]MCD9910722.1 phage portal protein [Bradyrhizobium japonicum]